MRYRVTVLDRENMPIPKLCANVVGFNRALFHAEHVSDKARLRGMDLDRVEIRNEAGELQAVIHG